MNSVEGPASFVVSAVLATMVGPTSTNSSTVALAASVAKSSRMMVELFQSAVLSFEEMMYFRIVLRRARYVPTSRNSRSGNQKEESARGRSRLHPRQLAI